MTLLDKRWTKESDNIRPISNDEKINNKSEKAHPKQQAKKWNYEPINPVKIVPDWNIIRNYLDNVKNEEMKNSLKILYLFGLTASELVKVNLNDISVKGTDLIETNINAEPALLLNVRTTNRGLKTRRVAIPLNTKYEPWAKDILDYCENLSDNPIYHNVSRILQAEAKVNLFTNFIWHVPIYSGKTTNKADDSFKLLQLNDVREWELGLCHGFNLNDFNNFFGKELNTDYTYFYKLLKKNDYYIYDDYVNAVELKEEVFTPLHTERYYMKEFIEIVKKMKRKYISMTGPIKLNLMNEVLTEYKLYKGKGEGEEHVILKKSIGKYLVTNYNSNINDITFELANLDVVDPKKGIIVECGHSNPVKLLDGFNDVLEGVTNINEFWVLHFRDNQNMNTCFKFTKNKIYRP